MPGSPSSSGPAALLLGATGGCGRHALARLLERGVRTTAVVRNVVRLPAAARGHPLLTVVVEPGGHLAMSQADFQDLVHSCGGMVVSCLGHNMTFSGMFGKPRRLCLDSVRSVCEAANAIIVPEAAKRPVSLVVLSSEGVSRPDGGDPERGLVERFVLWALEKLLPPHTDNVETLAYLHAQVAGGSNPHVAFVAVRPSDMIDGDAGEYTLHAALQNGIFNAGKSTRANVGQFMADLAADPALMAQWVGKYPQILDVGAPGAKKSS